MRREEIIRGQQSALQELGAQLSHLKVALKQGKKEIRTQKALKALGSGEEIGGSLGEES